MTIILIWVEEGRTEDTWSKLDWEWKSIRWAQVHLSPISCHIVPEGEKQLCNSSSKSRRKGAEESPYVWCACREHPVNEILSSSDDWSLQNHCSIRRKLARHSQPLASRFFYGKALGEKPSSLEYSKIQDWVQPFMEFFETSLELRGKEKKAV